MIALVWTLALIAACLCGSMTFLGLVTARWGMALLNAMTCGGCIGLCIVLLP